MGIFGKIKGIFSRKKKEIPDVEREPLGPPPSELRPEEDVTPLTREPSLTREPLAPMRLPEREEPLPRRTTRAIEPLAPRPLETRPLPPPETGRAEASNLRAKVDLLLTEMDSIKTQNQTINERLKAIEKTLTDMRGIRYY